MSSQGPGWWQASDGRWYPPEQHPDAVAASSPQPTAPGPPVGPPVGPAPGWTPLDSPAQGASTVPPAPVSPPPFGPPQSGQVPPYGQAPRYGQSPHFPQTGPYGNAPQRRRRSRRWPKVVVVLILLAGAGFVAVSWLGSELLEGGDTDVYDLSVGDCINDPVEPLPDEVVEVDSVDTVDCAEPHEAEVYALTDLPGDAAASFPGDDAVAQQADEICIGGFQDYVGAPYESSSLDYSYYVPTAQSWSRGDREVACLAVDYEGELLTGSVRGSGR
jgi:hypothetical protein